MQEKVSVRIWAISLAVFVLVILITGLVEQGDVTYGIIDHQAAGTAARVNEIQTQWRKGGVRTLAIVAVIADLAWIWLYALGAFLAGRGFATKREGILRGLGGVIFVVALIFGITDYTETISQLIQLLQDSGSDTLAQIAAFMQPIKIAAFLIAFFGIIAALILDRFIKPASVKGD